MSENNQAAFMGAVRAALGHPRDVRRYAPPGLFHVHAPGKSLDALQRIQNRGAVERQALMQTLTNAAKAINLDVCVVASPQDASTAIADKIMAAPVEWIGSRKVCVWEHPLIDRPTLSALLAEQEIPVISRSDFHPDSSPRFTADQRQRLRQGIIDSFVGITSADFCVADTATLVLRTHAGQPRSMSLVPSIHIAVIAADQILADFTELYATLRWGNAGAPMDLTTCMTFISGPSKTADIEATLVHGAHGPKAVWLYIITQA